MALTSATPDLIEALQNDLPDGIVSAVPEAYRHEPRGRYVGTATALARPRSVEDVVAILRFATNRRVGVVPYAGGTGLVGGQTPDQAQATILLSVERMSAIRDIDTEDNVIVAEAGAILADIRAMAEDHNRLFPLSLASEGSARIGGLLATNAGGVGVLRYGNARDLCLGVEAVLADGSVLHGLKRLRKDNTGYDLRHLLIGSEGTLGVITAASLKLVPRPVEQVSALAAVPDPASAIALLNLLRDRVGEEVQAFELMHRQGFDFLAEKLPETPVPFATVPEWCVLIDLGGPEGASLNARAEAALAYAVERSLIGDALIAQNAAQRQSFWDIRERIPEANRLIGSVSSHDISVPVARVPEFIDRGGPVVAAIDPSLRINCFGHLGDGNLHYNVFPARGRSRADHEHHRADIKRAVHDLAHALGGSVSAEHGVGRLKVGDLQRYGDPAKLVAMRAIKSALDPKGILNPGVILPAIG